MIIFYSNNNKNHRYYIIIWLKHKRIIRMKFVAKFLLIVYTIYINIHVSTETQKI